MKGVLENESQTGKQDHKVIKKGGPSHVFLSRPAETKSGAQVGGPAPVLRVHSTNHVREHIKFEGKEVVVGPVFIKDESES